MSTSPAQIQQSSEVSPTARSARKPHLAELDRMRIITAISVVAVHVTANTVFLDNTHLELQVQNGFVTALHFTREVFLFVTALALVYVYFDKPPTFRSFWPKRSIGVLIPYAIWSAIYVWINPHPASALPLIGIFLWDLLTGGASFQLYYILLTLEFYLLLPWFLAFLRRVRNHPWITLSVSFALEIVLLYVNQRYLQPATLPAALAIPVPFFVGRFVFFYQFYFVLGGFTALYIHEVRTFALRHGRALALAGIGALALIEAYYVYEIAIRHHAIADAVIVLQPIVAIYSLGIIAFLFWASYRGVVATQKRQAHAAKLRDIWRELSDTSFGVYLIHPIFITLTLTLVISHIRSWPTGVLVAIIWLCTATGSIVATLLLLRLPVLSRLMGRPGPTWEAFGARLSNTFSRLVGQPRTPTTPAFQDVSTEPQPRQPNYEDDQRLAPVHSSTIDERDHSSQATRSRVEAQET